MKNILLLLIFTWSFLVVQAQNQVSYESATYYDNISPIQVDRFLALHKQFTEMAWNKERNLRGEWVFKHLYGSGHAVVIYHQYDSMEDYHTDARAYSENISNKIEALTDAQEKEQMMAQWQEYRNYADGHSDEIRAVPSAMGFYTKDMNTLNGPFVMSVSRFNTNGPWSDFAQNFFDWQIKPQVDSNASLAAGVSYHYMGSGPEVEFWLCYASLHDLVEADSNAVQVDKQAKKQRMNFWNAIEGTHEDQIYQHYGHLNVETGKFE